MVQLDINDHLVIVGNLGRYQLLCLLLSGMVITQFGLETFVAIFIHTTPDFRCVDSDNQLVNGAPNTSANQKLFDNSCNAAINTGNRTSTRKCEKFEYDKSLFTSTVVTEFDLVCDRKHYTTILNMMWMASVGFGAIFGSYISDRFGRKPVIIVNYIVIAVFGSLSAVSSHVAMYMVFRFSMGLFCFAGLTSATALVTESVSPYRKSQGINVLGLCWVLGTASLSLWSYLLRNWKHLQIFISLSGLPCGIACFWLLDESPHWLMLNGRKQKALDILNKMARWNKVVTPELEMNNDLMMVDGMLEEKSDGSDSSSLDEKETCCEIWNYRRVVIRFFIFSAGWIACAFCYYALSFGVPNLPGNLFVNNFIMGIVEAVAYGCCFVVAIVGRKWPAVGSFMAAGLALLTSMLMQVIYPGAISITILSVVGKFFVSSAWMIVWSWDVEVYPTSHRCILASLNGTIGRIGYILGPYMVDLPKYIDVPNEDVILPSVFVALMVSVGLLHTLLPETNNRNLPKNLWQANQVNFPMAKKDDATGSSFASPGSFSQPVIPT